MLQKIVKTQTKTWTWGASTTVSQDIQASGAITRLVFRMAITGSGSLAAANQPDAFYRVIDSLNIKGAGGVHYYSAGSEQIGRLIHLLNRLDNLVKGVTTTIVATTNQVIFTIHFGSRPRDMFGRDNPFDLTAFIPAFNDTQLVGEWLTTANTCLDDTVTLSSGTGRLTIYEVLGTAQELKAEMMRQGVFVPDGYDFMCPKSSYKKHVHPSDMSDLSELINIPVGAFLRRIGMLVQDETSARPVRKNDEVTRVGIILPVGNQRIVDVDFVTMTNIQQVDQGLLVADSAMTGIPGLAIGEGFYVPDLRELGSTPFSPDYGMDLRGYKVGDVLLGLTIENYTSGDDTQIWWDQLLPTML